MGRFTEDMGRLRDEIESDRIARHTLIADTREEISANALAFITDLKESVETLQSKFREDFADMAQSNRADRNAFLAQLGNDVADIRVEAAERQASVREAFAESTAEARAERELASAVLRDQVADLQAGFRSARGEMATEVRAVGQAFVADIIGAVNGLRRETVQMVGDFGRERSEASQAWRSGAPKAPPPPPPVSRPKVQAKPVQKTTSQSEPMAKPADAPAEPDRQPSWARDDSFKKD
jgi:hypothetical protein